MIKQAGVAFVFAALSVAGASTYQVTLLQPAVVNGKELKAGVYQLDVKINNVLFGKGKKQVEVPAKIENTNRKYERTHVLFDENNGKLSIREIELGGTTTKVIFESGGS